MHQVHGRRSMREEDASMFVSSKVPRMRAHIFVSGRSGICQGCESKSSKTDSIPAATIKFHGCVPGRRGRCLRGSR
uniref:Uncharacterized protein n=1 Tax=Arundo donax TaxID=35708 RepID=A0A0A8YVN1_ARUDO